MKAGFISSVGKFSLKKWESDFKVASENGIRYLELIMNYPNFGPLTITDKEINELKRLSKKYSIEMGCHLLPNNYAVLKDKNYRYLNLASEDEETRKFSIEEIKRTLDIARKLDLKFIVVHCSEEISEERYKNHLRIARETLEKLNPYFKKVKLLIENMPTVTSKNDLLPALPRNPEDFSYLTKGLDNIGICFDIGHANTVMDPIKFYNKIKKTGKVWDMHIHDNKGIDNHLPIGKGNIDFPKFMNQLKEDGYQGYFNIELDTFIPVEGPMENKERVAALNYFRKLEN